MDEPPIGSETAEWRTGSQFGPYLLKGLLGSGGFGEVYEAVDTTKNRIVALKLLPPSYTANPNFRQRLFREASTAGRLNEPHVVPIHDYGEIDGQLYIDMRLIPGTDLRTVLEATGPLGIERAVSITTQIASALDAAHAAHIVHRDVKPANILLAPDDFACLVDFGLANAATDAKLTSAGSTLGTFAYMAPERFSGQDVDYRVDIYALACVLHECLTGAQPYQASDNVGLVAAHLTTPAPQPSQYDGVPAGFDAVIARGMAKEPEQRYPSAGSSLRRPARLLPAWRRRCLPRVMPDLIRPGPLRPSGGAECLLPQPASFSSRRPLPSPSGEVTAPSRAPRRPALSSPGSRQRFRSVNILRVSRLIPYCTGPTPPTTVTMRCRSSTPPHTR